MDALELDRLGPRAVGGIEDVGRDALGVGAERAQDDAAVIGVGAEQRVRVAEVARDEPFDVLGQGALAHATGSSSRRAMPATGIATQSGRLSSS